MFAKSTTLLLLGCLLAPLASAGLDIQHWHTPQGARVYFVANHDLPMIDASVDFAAGSARDGRATAGLANLTRHVMRLGAGPWSEREIEERLADVGAVLGGRFDADRAGFTLRTLSGARESDQAFVTLAAVLAAPHFDAGVLRREQARVIAGLREARTRPDQIGARAFQAAIYGDHPYGQPDDGEEDRVAALGRDDLVRFHADHYRAANMVITLMGDLTRERAEALAERLAAGLPPGEAPPALPPAPPVAATPGERVIPHHASQSHLFMGQPGMMRHDPDFFPLMVGNYVLGGGGFDSRLNEAVRQQRGLAYSVYSFFAPMQAMGPFQIGLQTGRATTREAVDTAYAELLRYFAEGPTEAELTQAKNALIGGFPLRLDSNRKILEHLAVIGFYRLPLDWLETWSARVDAVTVDDIRRAFQARLRPETMARIIVGGQLEPASE